MHPGLPSVLYNNRAYVADPAIFSEIVFFLLPNPDHFHEALSTLA
jgi:hypothetical protein